MFTLVLALACLLVYGISRWLLTRGRSPLPLPPGPPGHWLFGNTMPKAHAYRQFQEYTAEYGPIFSLRQGGRLLVVVGTYDAAAEIMEKEGASLADRPRNISAGETLSGNMRTLLIGQGGRLKKLRRALHALLQHKVAEEYELIQFNAARNVILDIIRAPGQFQNHTKRYAASVILSVTYGKTTPTFYEDDEVRTINKTARRLGETLRLGAWLVDSWPIMKYVPGYLSELKQSHREELALFRGQFEAVRQRMNSGLPLRPNFAKHLIERQREYELSDNEVAYLAGSMFGAGSDTTAAAINIIIMAAACYPHTQKRAQDELDLVIGRARMPTFGDREELNYINAFVLESFRWRPVSAGGFHHRATKDIAYGGFIIPAGATVAGNHWSIHHDPSVFTNPDLFAPERWLDGDGRIREDLRTFNFGFGRRVCPGQHVANRSLFMNTAMLLWSFDIYQDPENPIDTLAFTDTANIHPLPFAVNFSPRMDGLKDVVGNTGTA